MGMERKAQSQKKKRSGPRRRSQPLFFSDFMLARSADTLMNGCTVFYCWAYMIHDPRAKWRRGQCAGTNYIDMVPRNRKVKEVRFIFEMSNGKKTQKKKKEKMERGKGKEKKRHGC